MRFTAKLQRFGEQNATGFEVPAEVVDGLAGGKRPAVVVTINGHSWRSRIMPYGGRILLGVSAANRKAAGIAAGETVDVEVELDTAPRTVDVPADLAEAIRGAGLQAAWDQLAYTHRKEHVRAVEDAKKPETRERRIARTLEMLAAKS